jgi:negative regulator of sigma E activity
MNVGDLTFSEKGKEKVYGRNTRSLEVNFPKEKVKTYDGWRFVINQDVESKILLRIKIYDQDDQLIEYYGYENINLNAPLTNADFDPKNPEYYFWEH